MNSPSTTPAHALPQSGYQLEKLYASDLHLVVKSVEAESAPAGQVIFGWDWELLEASMFEVRLKLGLDPTPDRLEEVRLTLSGRFRMSAAAPSVTLTDFVKLHAVAILFPYARELLSHVTARGFYGPMLLPALNIMQLMGSRDTTQTTGARQLAAGYHTVYAARAVNEPEPAQPLLGEPGTHHPAPPRKRRARRASPPEGT
jgi:preprotein translocase subunit SecB